MTSLAKFPPLFIPIVSTGKSWIDFDRFSLGANMPILVIMEVHSIFAVWNRLMCESPGAKTDVDSAGVNDPPGGSGRPRRNSR